MFEKLFRKCSVADPGPKKPSRPTYQCKLWKGDMILKRIGSGKNIE